jgi:two-component system response regulator AtoC
VRGPALLATVVLLSGTEIKLIPVTQEENHMIAALGNGTRSIQAQAFVPGVSPAMRTLERVITEVSTSDVPVLVLGEPGTGKSVLATHIHSVSRRRDLPFVVLEAGLLKPKASRDTDLNGEYWIEALFAPGTVILEDINHLELQIQHELIQLLANTPSKVTAQLICTCRAELGGDVRVGHFREDLYYRIAGVCLRVPPLRHRREDIPVLADFFTAKYAARFGQPAVNIGPDKLAAMQQYLWPGNVRELEDVLKSVVALGTDEVVRPTLDISGGKQPPATQRLSLKQAGRAASLLAERELILTTLSQTHWNRKRAAKELQISYKALLYKLRQTGLDSRAVSHHVEGVSQ